MRQSNDTALISVPTVLGLDIGQTMSEWCLLSPEGEVLQRGSIRTRDMALRSFFAKLSPCRVILEACSLSPWISRLIAHCGHEVIVGNPRAIHLISKSKKKTDRKDAETLARLGRVDISLLMPINHRSEEAQKDLATLRGRASLVGKRTSTVVCVRSLAETNGEQVKRCCPEVFPKRARKDLSAELLEQLEPMLAVIDSLNASIKAYDERVEMLCRKYPVTLQLQEIPGVGPILSLSFVLTIEDPQRFKSSRRVGSFFGLVPICRRSGKQDPHLSITKQGDAEIRRLAVLAANYILGRGPDCELKRWGEAFTERGGKRARQKAKVAIARRLLVIMHRMWTTGASYDPFYATNQKQRTAA